MATLSIGKANFNIGANDNGSESMSEGLLSNLQRFAASAQVAADKYADYKYTQTDWRAIRPEGQSPTGFSSGSSA